jgi:peptide chain release factor 2
MVIKEDLLEFSALNDKLKEIKEYLKIEEKSKELKVLQNKMSSADFWNDNQKAASVNREHDTIKEVIDNYNSLLEFINETATILELLADDPDEGLEKEFFSNLKKINKKIDDLEFITLLSDDIDSNNAILNIHPGAGGTESCDWASMLLRMYKRWAEIKNYEVELLDYQAGEEAGIKNITLLIKGNYAFGYLKCENGIHRLVRISPFDSNARRHTSFASVHVMPEVDDTVEVDLEENDLRIDTYRASGAGGQHVNKTDSAVRITHIPTGIVVTCQNQKSQHQNKENAMKILMSRIYQLKQEEKEKELAKLSGEKKEIGWGHQIRSYVFHPYNMVKDHRTKTEIGNIQSVMDGEIDEFILSYLKLLKTM